MLFGHNSRGAVLVAPTCGEVWNKKAGKFLHRIFIITVVKEVKQALHLTS